MENAHTVLHSSAWPAGPRCSWGWLGQMLGQHSQGPLQEMQMGSGMFSHWLRALSWDSPRLVSWCLQAEAGKLQCWEDGCEPPCAPMHVVIKKPEMPKKWEMCHKHKDTEHPEN